MVSKQLFQAEEEECELAFWSLENHPDGILWATLDGWILFANLAMHVMGGYEPGALVGRCLTEMDTMLKPSEIGLEGHLTSLVMQGKVTEVSTLFRRADGGTISVKVNPAIPPCIQNRFVIYVKDTKGTSDIGDIGVRDVGEGKEALIKSFLTDQLTGTWLRRRFFETAAFMVDQSLLTATDLSLLFIDIDHFKEVNDRYGHNAGDEALRRAASSIVEVVRGENLLFRWGGDEFVVLLPGADLDTARSIAGRIGESIRAHGAGDELPLTASIGIAVYSPDEDIVEGWIARADAAMYRAKQSGRDMVAS